MTAERGLGAVDLALANSANVSPTWSCPATTKDVTDARRATPSAVIAGFKQANPYAGSPIVEDDGAWSRAGVLRQSAAGVAGARPAQR